MECSPVQWLVLSAKCFAQMTFECSSSNTKIVSFYIPSLVTFLLDKGSMFEVLGTITGTIFSKTTNAL